MWLYQKKKISRIRQLKEQKKIADARKALNNNKITPCNSAPSLRTSVVKRVFDTTSKY